ncbi:rhomboid family intramembrane serine protease [uncultured Mucilaginibacter sp.]|uniref:rhomboid family intramembrane serine protease n=1 Tax=uncultured Mucilaginibacter sp. TaxID=797541 RepID=UPI002605B8E2|nr:rhomboid family intramembrane serine protease [uncultured Mucilaginibacter sp.]
MNLFGQSPLANLTPVVKNLLIINIIFFIATLVFQSMGIELAFHLGAFYFNSPHFRVWQIITYMFMHGGWAHIFFNMFALYMFGPAIENYMGSKRFFNYYFITGLGALALQMLVQAIEVHGILGSFTFDPAMNYNISPEDVGRLRAIYAEPMVGASGALFGILVAFGVLYAETSLYIMLIPIPVKAKYAVIGYIVVELYLGLSQHQGDSVAHFAHLGGALFGYILLKIWGMHKTNDFY